MAKTFKFGENGKWATKTGSSMAYNDENGNFKPTPFAVTRASTATRVNKEGLIEVVGQDKLRIDYKDSSNGVALLEPSRTNLITYSEDFSDSSWSKLGAGTGTAATITSNYAISPDGSLNASRLQCDLNGGGNSSSNQSLIFDAITGTGNASVSIYVKSNTNSDQTFSFGNSLNDYENGVATSEWKRFEVNHSATNQNIFIGSRGTTNSDDVLDLLIWGAQVEAGSYATSYIPTSGSTYQRQADVANGAGNSEVFNDSEGVLYAEIAALPVTGRIALNDGTTSNNVRFVYNSGTNQIDGVLYNGTNQATLNYVLPIEGTFNKIAFKYKASDFALWVDGFEVDSQTGSGTTFTSGTLSELDFDAGNGLVPFYGKTKQLGYYDAVLTDAELEALTSYTSFTNMANELNLTIK